MYYIYQLLDPRDMKPFYIGKGKGRRASTHLWETPETRNVYKQNKIASIRNCNLEPIIDYIVVGLIDEESAYELEAELIKMYGRKGYDKFGTLTNICLDARPPNHKGKTYEDIYRSKDEADKQRKLRADLQKERGGYGPKIFSDETKKKLSIASSGKNNPMYGKSHSLETIQKIINNRTPSAGEQHYASKHWVLTDPLGNIFEQIGNLQGLCEELGLSFVTMSTAYRYKRIPRTGPAKGWKISIK